MGPQYNFHHRMMMTMKMVMIRETRRLGEQQRQVAGKAGNSFAQSSLQVSLHTDHDDHHDADDDDDDNDDDESVYIYDDAVVEELRAT